MDRTHRGRAVRGFGALVGGRCPMDLGGMRCAFCRCGAASRRRGPHHVPPRPGPIRQNGSLAFCWALPAGLGGLRRLASLDAGARHLGVLGTFFLAFWAKSPLGNLPHMAGTCAGLGHGRCADRHPAPCTTRFIGSGDAFLAGLISKLISSGYPSNELEIKDCIKFAVVCGLLTCLGEGAIEQQPYYEKVNKFLGSFIS